MELAEEQLEAHPDLADIKGIVAASGEAKWTIEAALDRCVIHEYWIGAGGSNGQSFNIYNTATRQWEQFWVDNGGNRLHLKGGLVDGAMVLRGTQDVANAKTGLTQHERITWTPNADGSVRQRWETSTDDGKTWTVAFDGIYRKATTPAS